MSKLEPIRVLALTRYGAQAASTRQRLLQYLPYLADAGIIVDWYPLLDDDYVRSLAEGSPPSKSSIAAGYVRRLGHLASARRYDLLWIYAELFPYLPSGFERLAFLPGIPTIYDFDDAFFEQYDSHRAAGVRRLLMDKLKPLVAGVDACCCGNAYLQHYARQLNERTILLPTVVDTDAYIPAPRPPSERLTLGWIGTPSTWQYLRPLLPVFQDLALKYKFRVRIVGAGPAAVRESTSLIEAVAWSESSEVSEVQGFDIGMMPLPDDRWARGKSGYKLIQYMACGIPVVASPVGANTDIVREYEMGLFATTPGEWSSALASLLENAKLRDKMGENGRRRVEKHYSLRTSAPVLVDLFRETARRRAA